MSVIQQLGGTLQRECDSDPDLMAAPSSSSKIVSRIFVTPNPTRAAEANPLEGAKSLPARDVVVLRAGRPRLCIAGAPLYM